MLDLGIEGRRAIVTGAGSGIGQAVALQLLGEGSRVTAVDINDRGLDPVREAVRLGRLAPGMTREQALITAGYPATHRTPVLEAPVWTYWHDRLTSYRVTWDGTGRIEHIATQP